MNNPSRYIDPSGHAVLDEEGIIWHFIRNAGNLFYAKNHNAVRDDFASRLRIQQPGNVILTEQKLPAANRKGTDGDGFADIVDYTSAEVWDVKPNSFDGRTNATILQLSRYQERLGDLDATGRLFGRGHALPTYVMASPYDPMTRFTVSSDDPAYPGVVFYTTEKGRPQGIYAPVPVVVPDLQSSSAMKPLTVSANDTVPAYPRTRIGPEEGVGIGIGIGIYLWYNSQSGTGQFSYAR